jgi:hypothetical protein
MGPRAATVEHLRHLEAAHRRMVLANRYLAAGRPKELETLGFDRSEIRRLTAAGGYPASDLTRSRDTIRYYRTKSRRRLWLPDTGEKA